MPALQWKPVFQRKWIDKLHLCIKDMLSDTPVMGVFPILKMITFTDKSQFIIPWAQDLTGLHMEFN